MLAVKTVVDVFCSVPVFVEVLRGTVVGCTVVIARRKKKQRLAVFKIFHCFRLSISTNQLPSSNKKVLLR